jgi:hypothetical protein
MLKDNPELCEELQARIKETPAAPAEKKGKKEKTEKTENTEDNA